jgi:hypothetical protein
MSKLLYDGEWVRVRNLMSQHFSAARPCSRCGRFACALVWYSIRSREVRCLTCFAASCERQHAERFPTRVDALSPTLKTGSARDRTLSRNADV